MAPRFGAAVSVPMRVESVTIGENAAAGGATVGAVQVTRSAPSLVTSRLQRSGVAFDPSVWRFRDLNTGRFVAHSDAIITTLELPTPSALARAAQGTARFPGVDRFRDIQLRKGTVLVAGEPGFSGFFTTESGFERVGRDATRLFRGLQVPPRAGLFRPGAARFELTEDAPAAFGFTLANPQYGPGGLPQVYLPDYAKVTKQTLTILLDSRVAPVP